MGDVGGGASRPELCLTARPGTPDLSDGDTGGDVLSSTSRGTKWQRRFSTLAQTL